MELNFDERRQSTDFSRALVAQTLVCDMRTVPTFHRLKSVPQRTQLKLVL